MAKVAILGITGCAVPQGIAPSRGSHERLAEQQFIPGEVVVAYTAGTQIAEDLDPVGPGTAIYHLLPAQALDAAVAMLLERPGITGAGANLVVRAADGDMGAAVNDPLFPRQWYLNAIGAPEAWQVEHLKPVSVAIVDSGIDAGHPEFAGRLQDGVSFVSGKAEPADDSGHGTHIAGLLGAITNNNFGIAGMASNVRIIPVKVLDRNGLGSLDWVLAGIAAAREAGARVINLSLSMRVSSQLLDRAIKGCQEAGIVVIAAAGNDGSEAPEFPAASPGAIAIGATDTRNTRASFSNGGPHVRLAAPGVDMVSTLPRLLSGTGFGVKQGTSMAAPLVSGVVATLLGLEPRLTPQEIEALLYQTGVPVAGPGDVRRVDFSAALRVLTSKIVPEPPKPEAPQATPQQPTAVPTQSPLGVASPQPTAVPTQSPLGVASPQPTAVPTQSPLGVAGPQPTAVPSLAPFPVSKPLPTPAVPGPTRRPSGQLPAWGFVDYEGLPLTPAPNPPSSAPATEGIRKWGSVSFGVSTAPPAAVTPLTPGATVSGQPVRVWGFVPIHPTK